MNGSRGPDSLGPELTGEQVRLRSAAPADLARLREILAEPSVRRWWNPVEPHAAAADWLAPRPGTTVFIIEVDGATVGSIQCHEESDPDYRHAAIDLFLAGDAQGRGLGPDAIRTLARWLIDERGHHRLTIDPAAANDRAIRAYLKVGFQPVGRLRDYERGPDGTWRDGLLMDLVAGELTWADRDALSDGSGGGRRATSGGVPGAPGPSPASGAARPPRA